jgi:hypothetical protein
MDENGRVCVQVSPGICGFNCKVYAQKIDRRAVALRIEGSECKQILRLAKTVTQLSMQDLFKALTKNPVFVSAEKAGCHSTCSVPTAILKASETALGMALRSDVMIKFDP